MRSTSNLKASQSGGGKARKEITSLRNLWTILHVISARNTFLSDQKSLRIVVIGELRYPVPVVVQILEVEGYLVHGVTVLVCLVKGAPGA